MATAARSAAERVFAIAELLEDIVLHVIHDELEDPWVKRRYLATSFDLQRINRDAYRNIAGSTKIRELALIGTGTAKLDTWHRICWLSCECTRWDLRPHTWSDSPRRELEYGYFFHLASRPRRTRLDDNPDASWRALPCLLSGAKSVDLEIWQSIPSRFWYLGMNAQPLADDLKYMTGELWRKRLTTWKLNDQYTLGQLYDDLSRIEHEQSEAFAKG